MATGKEVIGLQTPRGRLVALGLATFVIFILPYRVVGQFSLWGHLGWDAAPSVGLTRAYWLLLHGDPTAAWHRNRLIFVVLAILLLLLIRDIRQLRSDATE